MSKEDIERLLSLKTTLTEVVSILCISRATLYKLMRKYNISTATFAVCSDEQLDSAIADIKAEHPHVGEVMLNGHLGVNQKG